MQSKKIHYLVQGAMIATLYIVLTVLSRMLGLADGAVQFRISEALTVLPAFTPAAIPGLTVGCFLANWGSPFGIIDVLAGTLATFVGAVFTYMLRKVTYKNIPILAPVPPIIANGIIVSGVISIMNEVGQLVPQIFSFSAFFAIALSVIIGEVVVCAVLGIPLMIIIQKTKLDNTLALK